MVPLRFQSVVIGCMFILACIVAGSCGSTSEEQSTARIKAESDSLALVELENARRAAEEAAATAVDSVAAEAGDEEEDGVEPADEVPANGEVPPGEEPVPDTAEAPAPVPKPAKAPDKVTVFQADTQMVEGRTYKVFAEVGLKSALSEVIESVKEKANENHKLLKVAPITQEALRTSFMPEAVEVELKLTAPANDFEITSLNAASKKNVEDQAGELHWDWSVVPKRPTPTGSPTTLELQVTYWRADGVARDGEPETLPIEVNVDDRNTFIALWQFLRQNPEYFLTALIIPLLGGAWKWWSGMRAKTGG